jgi:hypothetical protein
MLWLNEASALTRCRKSAIPVVCLPHLRQANASAVHFTPHDELVSSLFMWDRHLAAVFLNRWQLPWMQTLHRLHKGRQKKSQVLYPATQWAHQVRQPFRILREPATSTITGATMNAARKRISKLGWRELWPVWLTFSGLFAVAGVGAWVLLPATIKPPTLITTIDLIIDLKSLEPNTSRLCTYPLNSGVKVDFFVERGAGNNVMVAFACAAGVIVPATIAEAIRHSADSAIILALVFASPAERDDAETTYPRFEVTKHVVAERPMRRMQRG